MKQLEKLKNLALQLSSAADLLTDYTNDVVLVPETDDSGEILFPNKLKVIEVMAMAIREMRAIENFVNALPDEDVHPDHSTAARSDECYLSFSKREAEPWLSYLQNHHRELGEIMDVISVDSDQIDEEDFQWMLMRLALTRRTIDEILDSAKHQLHLPRNHFFNSVEENQKERK
ncbi:MAG: hypothetical protein IJT28_02320 [Bacteroidaceae bacterium]|nr:hypothetical protein [Bacteroidaceae bacterium]